ncbi:MAG: GTP-binding protein [Rhizobium sp.]|nr:GTP-binding protein [Rhizobium sp.]
MTAPLDRRVPVIVLGGFLGSGKTTLLKRLLERGDGPRTAVIINEFGEISLDHLLVSNVEGNSVVLKNGCVCCVIRTDLQSALRDLLDAKAVAGGRQFDRIVIETTGLADPGPIAQTLGTDPMLRRQTRLAGIVCTVDAMNGAHQIGAHEECLQQIAIADRIALTKTDLIEEDAVGSLTGMIAGINVRAGIFDLQGQMATGDDVEALFETDGTSEAAISWIRCAPALTARHANIENVLFETLQPVDWTAFAVWLSAFVHHYADDVLRIKGLLTVPGAAGPIVLDVVRNHIHPPRHLSDWPDDSRASRIVFIVRNIEVRALKLSLLDFLGHAPEIKQEFIPPALERAHPQTA